MCTFTVQCSRMAKLKKHTLLLEDEIDFELIGICSPHNDYRVAWGINNIIRIDLSKKEDLFEVYSKKGQFISQHSYYQYTDQQDGVVWYMIKNKYEGKFLIPEKNQIDYFLVLRNNVLVEVDEVLDKVKSLSSIVAAYSFESSSLPSAQLIQFE